MLRIVEVGHTGVGKTTYMASMYGALQNKIEGFSLRAIDRSDHSRLLKIATAIQQGKYPSPTDQRSEYNFYLQYQGKDIFRFCWADYRGGAIRETQDSEQARLLLQDLREADGVLMFCDCQALARRDRRTNQIGRMISLMNNALQNLERPLALGVVLTKTDLVEEVKGLEEIILEPFQGLFQAIDANDKIAATIIPVACGTELLNVEIPVLFALLVGVNTQVARLSKEMDEHKKMAEYYESQTHGIGGFLREAWDELVGNTTYREMAQSRYAQVQSKYKELEPIIEPVKALNKYLCLDT
ncbi:MAG: hypothetical protein SAK29_34915 [Scytonema sp. PMC 1069.18]|nr:hypothetical protein [Scytonema sp. PMC 1069.18]MEC4880187.1 hypothetical protein [Scytonema sp. PMC 1070.18]